jgi:hypothetical protein
MQETLAEESWELTLVMQQRTLATQRTLAMQRTFGGKGEQKGWESRRVGAEGLGACSEACCGAVNG